MQFQSDWTDEEIERLKALWAEGRSAGQISRVMPGRSRNAVIGKVHRLGLMGRPSAPGPRPRLPMLPRAPKAAPKPVTPSERQKTIAALNAVKHPEPARLENGQLIGTADLDSKHCRWSHGDVGAPGFHFCGLPQIAGSSWCDFHHRRAWQPSQKTVAAAASARRHAEIEMRKSQASFRRMGLA